jgi:hypothetical protein
MGLTLSCEINIYQQPRSNFTILSSIKNLEVFFTLDASAELTKRRKIQNTLFMSINSKHPMLRR